MRCFATKKHTKRLPRSIREAFLRSLRLSWRPCSAGGAAAAGVHADMAGAAAMPLLVAAAAVVTGNLGLGACGLVVGGNVAIALAVAVTAADGITLAGVMDLDVVQAAAASLLGVPDLGLVCGCEQTKHAQDLASCVDLPFLIDADTGYGNELNVRRTMRDLEAAGICGALVFGYLASLIFQPKMKE